MQNTYKQRLQQKEWRARNSGQVAVYKARHRKKGRANKRDDVQMVVYVIEAGEFIKIGIAENIKTRLMVFRTHCPLPLRLSYCSKKVLRPQAREIEVSCHERFAGSSLHGEWFKESAETVVRFLDSQIGRSDEENKVMQLSLIA